MPFSSSAKGDFHPKKNACLPNPASLGPNGAEPRAAVRPRRAQSARHASFVAPSSSAASTSRPRRASLAQLQSSPSREARAEHPHYFDEEQIAEMVVKHDSRHPRAGGDPSSASVAREIGFPPTRERRAFGLSDWHWGQSTFSDHALSAMWHRAAKWQWLRIFCKFRAKIEEPALS